MYSIRQLLPVFALVWFAAACQTSIDLSSTLSPVPSPRPSETVEPLPTPRPYRLRSGELLLAASPGDIPAVFANDGLFVTAEKGDLEWDDGETVVGVAINGMARAYPVRLLSLHEIVNDVVGGQPLAVTWCPLCFSAIVFDRVLDRELTFGASGYLFKNNLVMYDHQTNTLWSQLLGEAIRGAYDRQRLEILPSVLTSWGSWKQGHPETEVLSAERLGLAAQDVVDPYAGYYTSGARGLGGPDTQDDRLPGKTLVAGLRVGATARAYPFEAVREMRVINDQIEILPLLLVYNEAFENLFFFDRRLPGRTLTFDATDAPGALRDRETGTTWDVNSGLALEGELAGQRLVRLSAPLVFWFAWADLHTGSEIYSP